MWHAFVAAGGRRGYLLRSECAKHFKKLMASTLEEVRKKLEACPDLPALPAAQHSPCVQGSAPQRISAAAAAAGQVGSAGGAAGGEASLFGAAVLNSRGGSCSSSGVAMSMFMGHGHYVANFCVVLALQHKCQPSSMLSLSDGLENAACMMFPERSARSGWQVQWCAGMRSQQR